MVYALTIIGIFYIVTAVIIINALYADAKRKLWICVLAGVFWLPLIIIRLADVVTTKIIARKGKNG